MLPSGVDRSSRPARGSPLQLERRAQRAGRRRAVGVDAHRQASRQDSPAPSAGMVAQAARQHAAARPAAHGRRSADRPQRSATRRTRAATALPTASQARPAAAPAFRLQHVVGRVARCGLRARRAGPRRAGRWPTAPRRGARRSRGRDATGRRRAAAARASSRLPRRYSTQPRLSVMNGSPGLSSSAFLISVCASGSRTLRSASE